MKINFLPILAGAARGVGQNLEQQQLERLRQEAFNRQMQGQRDLMTESAKIRQGETTEERTYRQNEEKRQREEINALFLKAQSGQPLTPFEKQTYDNYVYNQKLQALKLQGEEADIAYRQKATSMLGRGAGGQGSGIPGMDKFEAQTFAAINPAIVDIMNNKDLTPEQKDAMLTNLEGQARADKTLHPGAVEALFKPLHDARQAEYTARNQAAAPITGFDTPNAPFMGSFAPAPNAPIMKLKEGSQSIIKKTPAFRVGKWGYEKAKETGKWLWGKQ
jgi:hypothetical protein